MRDQTPLKTKGELSTAELRMEYRRAPNLSLLLDDSPVIQCIQAGIDQGQFVYREGDKIWGKGDPRPTIRIHDGAFVATMEHAKKQGLWPRAPKPEPASAPAGSAAGSSAGVGQAPAPAPVPQPGTAAGVALDRFSAEGPLASALKELFEKTRRAKAASLRWLEVKLFDLTSTSMFHAALASYRDAAITVTFAIDVRDEDVESFTMNFVGSYAKASKVRSNLEPLLRAARETDMKATYRLVFEQPMATAAAKGDALCSLLTKHGGGEAYVEAEAAAQGGGR